MKGGKEMEHRLNGQGSVITLLKEDLSYTKTSKQIEDFSGNHFKEPPINPQRLLEVVERSDNLPALIDTMATNLSLFGWGVRYKENFDYSNAKKDEQNEANREWQQLNELFTYFNLTEPFERVIYRALIDLYTIGYGMIEIFRDETGRICGGEYARAAEFRIANNDITEQYADVSYIRNTESGLKETITKRRFKKFIQKVNIQERYFKEFGDPRYMDCETGEYTGERPENSATELLFITHHNPGSDYGNPVWIGCIPEILGNRKASEVNLDFFNNGKMIPFAILTNGGLLTQESIDAIRNGKGLDNFFKCLILEAKAPQSIVDASDGAQQAIDVKIQPLTDTSLKDGLFQDYQKNSREKVRGSFRIPPIYLGDSADYTRSTSDTARSIAEEQVFVPVRRYIASTLNMVLEYEFNLKYCELYFKGPQIGSAEELSNALSPYIQAGAVTPNMLIDSIGKLLGKDFEPFPDDIGNVPIELLKLMQNQGQEQQDEPIQKTQEQLSGLLNELEQFVGDQSCL